MANRYYNQFVYNLHKGLVEADCQITFGASGAVASIASTLVSSVTLLHTGVFLIQLMDNYTNCYQINWSMQSTANGTAVDMGSLVTGTLYQIASLGTSTSAEWIAAGLPAGLTAAVGMQFVATAAGAGTGTVNGVTKSGIYAVEAAGPTNLMLQPSQPTQGGYLVIQTLNASDALTNPAEGCVLCLEMLLSNSSSPINGVL